DIVTTDSFHNTVTVRLGKGDGTFLPETTYATGNGPGAVVVGDFNHDGILDIATANAGDNTVSVLLGRGDGTFSPAKSFPAGNSPSSLAAGDFNHDGILDLVTTTLDNTVSVLLGRGNGTFLPSVSFAVGTGPDAVAVGDFNHDGNVDLVTANFQDNSVSVLLGLGKSALQFETSTPTTGIAIRQIPYLQDLNGDGVPDELVLNNAGDLLFRRGLSGTPDQFAPPVTINPGAPARDATVFRSASGWAVAAVDEFGNTVS